MLENTFHKKYLKFLPRFLRFLQYVLLCIKHSLKHLQPFFLRLHGQHNSAANNAIGDADSSVGAT